MHKQAQPTINEVLAETLSYWMAARGFVSQPPLAKKAGVDPDSPRAAHYIALWDVPGKVRASKLKGTFHKLTGG